MIKEDYLLRIIQELGRKIAELVEKRTQGHVDEGIVLARAIFREHLGVETEYGDIQIDEEMLKQWSAQQTDLMADAAYETALLYWQAGEKTEAENFKKIASYLYRRAELKDQTYSWQREDKQMNINNIIK